MKFKHWSGKLVTMSISEAVAYEIMAEGSEAGRLEQLEQQVKKLAELVGSIVESLSEYDATLILTKHGSYHMPLYLDKE